jgi:hypothetical protein
VVVMVLHSTSQATVPRVNVPNVMVCYRERYLGTRTA